MHVIGLIAEYNPFHLGHRYQIRKIKELYPDSLIIAVISTCFTQRGDISIMNKWHKTRICLEEDIDLILELPTLYATQGADMFAYGALKILNEFHIDTLVFGSESDDTESLIKLANIQLSNKDYQSLVKNYLDEGLNYPTAMSKALKDITNTTVDKPNDILALSYIKEIIKNNYPITPVSIKRTNDYHAEQLTDGSNIISASLIRKIYLQGLSVAIHVPNGTDDFYYPRLSMESAFPLISYSIVANKEHLNTYLDIDEGVDSRILKFLYKSTSYQELVNSIKTKRYTYNKINRMLLHILLNIKNEDNTKDIYLRVLGFNFEGRMYLSRIKKKLNYPVITSYKPNISPVLDIEYRTTYIYSLITKDRTLLKKETGNSLVIR